MSRSNIAGRDELPYADRNAVQAKCARRRKGRDPDCRKRVAIKVTEAKIAGGQDAMAIFVQRERPVSPGWCAARIIIADCRDRRSGAGRDPALATGACQGQGHSLIQFPDHIR